ncbi:MAG TPA: 50S ribosomal protein L29 [Saprospiraceae bacterium]|nr:50S ribosomal protein L29 [Saprospiraceae bacterium]HND86916.1 50S ribosomal protein L29 [Saprospiraceae bacterium]HNG89152.1 50S ribosomal protein L29 [Saprospiraceae bacterium]
MAKNTLNVLEMSDADLRSNVASMENEYRQMKFDHAAKGLANPLELRGVRRDIARILTEIRRREIAAMSPEEIDLRSKIRERRRKNR